MRRFRAAVLAVLAIVMAAGALAPATAQAATQSIRWEGPLVGQDPAGSRLLPWQSVFVCVPGPFENLEQGQTVVTQVLTGGAWVTRDRTVVQDPWSRCVEVTPAALVAKPGRYSVRALFQPGPGAAVLSARTTVTLVRERSFVGVPSGTTLYATTARATRTVTASVSPARGQYVVLQRRAGDRWVRVSRVRAGTSGDHVLLPVPRRAGLSRYRAVVQPSAWSHRHVSTSFSMHQTDVVEHRRYISAARRHIARFCPSNPIHIDTEHVRGRGSSGRVGTAESAWSTSWDDGAQISTITTRIDLRSGLAPAHLRSVALHECAHAVQHRAHVVGRWDRERSIAERLWPRLPEGHEGQADCMAYVITRDPRWFGYVDGCSPKQLTNARRMWREYGVRFRAHPYTWDG